jgi:toxin FitB
LNFLLDTNVISELRRKRPDPQVLSWLKLADPTTLCVSVLTLGEIAKGAAKCAMRDRAQAVIYFQWLERVRSDYTDRTIAVDTEIAEAWGQLAAKRTLPVIDGLLAATALVRDMTFVTRDTRDIANTGVRTFNPWIA